MSGKKTIREEPEIVLARLVHAVEELLNFAEERVRWSVEVQPNQRQHMAAIAAYRANLEEYKRYCGDYFEKTDVEVVDPAGSVEEGG